ncbi:hypothetical protein HDV63DRAFT_390066 [Trichoderma sp. SZMC 28014]
MLGSNHLRLPAGDANPPIVRKYLANILHFSYNVPAEHAEALVSGWQYGRGRELVHYDIATFRQIFGAEVGALLYHHMANKSHISTAPSSRMDNSMAKKDLFGLPPGVTIMYLFLTICIISGLLACIQILKGSSDYVGNMLKLSGFFFIAFMYLYIMIYYV